jgi:putative membrane protein
MDGGRKQVRAVLWLVIFFAVLIWSVIRPYDLPTWILEVTPALIGLAVLGITRRRFPLTTLSYVLILIFSIILMVGGHYTYARVPLFDTFSTWFGWGRNNYDKLGHFAQGFVPAIIAREILLRLAVVNGRGWLNLFVLSLCLAISALYELVEWSVAMVSGEAAAAFLGTQGYVWDTQSDMAMALVGAIAALLLLGRVHDRQLARLARGGRMDHA